MVWFTEANTEPDELLQLRPELEQRYRAFLHALWQEGQVPRRVLELCQIRIAAIHDCPPSWWPATPPPGAGQGAVDQATQTALRSGLNDGNRALFSDAEAAALSVAEQIPHAHHAIVDGQIAELRSTYGNAGAVALITAMAFFDVNARLRLALGVDVPSAQQE